MGRALLYLDQAYYTALLRPQNAPVEARLRGLVSTGRLVCPISMFHFIETAKIDDMPLRRRVVRLMKVLSGGFSLRSVDHAWRLERDAFRLGKGTRWVRSRLLATGSFLDSLTLLETAEVDPAVVASIVDQSLQKDAVAANAVGPVAWTKVRDSLAQAVGLRRPEMPGTRAAFTAMFPSQAVRLALDEATFRARKAGVEPNDLVDFMFVSNVLTYFDGVTVDRRTGARVADAERAGTLPVHSCIVVRRFGELLPAVERIMGDRVSSAGDP